VFVVAEDLDPLSGLDAQQKDSHSLSQCLGGRRASLTKSNTCRRAETNIDESQ